MSYKVLSEKDIEQFIEKGWVKVEQAFDPADALAAQDFLWEQLEKKGALKDDPSTWNQPMIHMREGFRSPAFDKCNTLKFTQAREDLVGEGNLKHRQVYGENEINTHWGWWPVNFSLGSDRPWDVSTVGWHWDGIQFKHFINSPDQGLLCLCFFSEINSRGGATLVAEGSHHIVAKFLAEQKDGIELHDAIPIVNRSHPWLAELTKRMDKEENVDIYEQKEEEVNQESNRIEKFMEQEYEDPAGFKLRVIEATGKPGDVYLCHPFLYHSQAQNHLNVPRFMCNRTAELKEPLNLQRLNENEYTPLEKSIRYSLSLYS